MLTTIDYAIAALVGFLVGLLAIPTVLNVGVREALLVALLPWVFAPLFALGVWLGGVLGRRFAPFTQFGKFVAVGSLNTALDFAILNLLSAASGVTAGFLVGGVNVPGFLIAVTNSYFWNKYWVFRQSASGTFTHDFPRFFGVTLVGLLVNSGIVVAMTTLILSPFEDPTRWLNIAKVFATLISLVWNFAGYRLFVFRRQEPPSEVMR